MKAKLSQKQGRSPETKEVTIQLPLLIYLDVVDEAKRLGRSLDQVIAEAIILRKSMPYEDPWPGLHELWNQNQDIDPEEVEKDIAEAVAEVRQERQERIRRYREEGV